MKILRKKKYRFATKENTEKYGFYYSFQCYYVGISAFSTLNCRYIPVDKRDENDQATHKWMVYVRGGADEPDISGYVSKVWFFLHPSYRPNDLVEITLV